MAVNCSERKNPPISSTANISSAGVAGENSAQIAIDSADSRAFQVSTERKPKRTRTRCTANFISSAPAPEANGHQSRVERAVTKRRLQQQRQQKGDRTDADAEQRTADDADAKGRDGEQPQVDDGVGSATRM